MTVYSLAAILISIAAAISYINARFVKMQPSAALMLGALIISIALVIMHKMGVNTAFVSVAGWVVRSDLQHLLLNGILSFLLFAGALQIDLKQLRRYFLEIIILSGPGTIISTILITCCLYIISRMLGLPISWIDCALFGALISPTDPVAVLSMFKHLKAPEELNVCISGEALFNDGVGIVLFLSLLIFATTHSASWQDVTSLFVREAVGGIVFGVVLGFIGERMLRHITDIATAVFITIALVAGGYALAQHFELSGPLAMVVAGLFIDHEIKTGSESIALRRQLTSFWSILDDILNAILFTLLGFELLVIHLQPRVIAIAAIMIALILLVRFITTAPPIKLLELRKKYCRHFKAVLTWGGLRGGLSLALALSLPHNAARETIITITFIVVAFAVLIQSNIVRLFVKQPNN